MLLGEDDIYRTMQIYKCTQMVVNYCFFVRQTDILHSFHRRCTIYSKFIQYIVFTPRCPCPTFLELVHTVRSLTWGQLWRVTHSLRHLPYSNVRERETQRERLLLSYPALPTLESWSHPSPLHTPEVNKNLLSNHTKKRVFFPSSSSLSLIHI